MWISLHLGCVCFRCNEMNCYKGKSQPYLFCQPSCIFHLREFQVAKIKHQVLGFDFPGKDLVIGFDLINYFHQFVCHRVFWILQKDSYGEFVWRENFCGVTSLPILGGIVTSNGWGLIFPPSILSFFFSFFLVYFSLKKMAHLDIGKTPQPP